MIVCYSKKFVFVKTTKTAGTSIEIALTQYCDDGDIITPLHPDDEEIKQQLGLRGPQNCLQTLSDSSKLEFFNHAPARRAKRIIGPKDWPNWFTFSFERNPYDRVVSAFHYVKKHRIAKGYWDENVGFSEFLEYPNSLTSLHKNGWGLYTNNDKIIVDKIYRFEDLDDAMKDIYRRLDINVAEKLLKTKTSKRSSNYRDYYNDADRKRVASVFEKEIEAFSYSF